MFTKKKSGFTLIELLVVMIIIAILASIALPAILKARQQATINKVMAEMTSFASTGGSIYLDLKSRGYVNLADYKLVDPTAIVPPGFSSNPLKIDTSPTAVTGYATTNFTSGTGNDFVDLADFATYWDGPYAVYQDKSIFISTGNPPGADYPKAGGGVLLSANDGNPILWSPNKFPTGTPLDAWGHPFGMAWNATEQVMIIYSAGPDGNFQIVPGATTVTTGDDRLYKFR